MNYEKKYNKALTAVKKLQETNPSDEGIQNWINDNFPELNESEDERIRKAITSVINFSDDSNMFYSKNNVTQEQCIAWLEKQKPIKVNAEDEKIRKTLIRFHKSTIDIDGIKGDEILAWLEKQGKDKEINNFDVTPGLYKCVHRMFDGTPDGKLLFEVGNIYKCLSKHSRAEFEVSYGHSIYLEDPVVCKHFIPFKNKVKSKL